MAKMKNKYKNADFGVMLSVILITMIGIIMVYSSSSPEATFRFEDGSYFAKRHIMWAIVGMFVFILTINIDYHVWKKLSPYIFFISILMVMAIYTPLGVEFKGARRWINLGFTTIMPSDVIKISSVIFFAAFLDNKKDKIKSLKYGTLPAAMIIGISAIFVYLQPDLSTTATIVGSLGLMYFVGGMHLGWFVVIPPVIALIWKIAIYGEGNEYRLRRLTAFRDPFADKLGSGWQVVQSLYALGSGGMLGVGIGKSRQKYLYISEAYNDFIFAIIGEEWGFVGAMFVLLLYSYIIFRGIVIAVNAKDLFGTYLATGIISLFTLQTLINIGTVTSSIPATGITLPLMSFGGTSLVIYLGSLGILLNISRQRRSVKK